jgi:hypothetical protein
MSRVFHVCFILRNLIAFETYSVNDTNYGCRRYAVTVLHYLVFCPLHLNIIRSTLFPKPLNCCPSLYLIHYVSDPYKVTGKIVFFSLHILILGL